MPKLSEVSREDAAVIERRVQTFCLVVLTAIALGFALYWLRPVLVPFVLALFFVYCIGPVMDVLQHRFRLKRLQAVAVTFGLGFIGLVFLGTVLTATVSQIQADAQKYEAQLVRFAEYVRENLPHEQLGISSAFLDQVTGHGQVVDEGETAEQGGPLEVQADTGAFSPGQWSTLLNRVLVSLVGLISQGFLVAIFVLFLLLGNSGGATRGDSFYAEVQRGIRHYIVLKITISLVTASLHGFVLWVLGVEYAFMIGVLVFYLNFIPNIGPITASLLALPVLVLDPDLSMAVRVLGFVLPAAVQFVSGSVIEPKLMGDSLGLHPAAVLISLIFFGMIWGIIGMFLSTPIAVAIKIVLQRIDYTRPMAQLLAGRVDDAGAEP